MFVAVGLGVGSLASTACAEDPVVFTYETLKYGSADTFLTGIRGNNIVGNYVIPGTTETGGIYYNMATQTWSPMPVATENGANFPGAIGSSPYGPSFGTPTGILRVVGTYQTEASAPYDLSYFYDGVGGRSDDFKPTPQQRLLLELARNFTALPSRRHQEAICGLVRALVDPSVPAEVPGLELVDVDPGPDAA